MPQKYSEARRALEAAATVDEVKEIHNKAMAAEVYAAQARDGKLIGFATEIRKRAERRLGQVMAQMRAAGLMAKAGRRGKNQVSKNPNLESQGIDKNLANRARKAAAMPEEKFAAEVAKSAKVAVASVDGTKEVISAPRAERHVMAAAKPENGGKPGSPLPYRRCGHAQGAGSRQQENGS
jgi:hypothetical protein